MNPSVDQTIQETFIQSPGLFYWDVLQQNYVLDVKFWGSN